MRDSLKKGTSLDELWKVARGKVKYGDFISKQKGGQKKKPAEHSAKQSMKVPEELVPPHRHLQNPSTLVQGTFAISGSGGGGKTQAQILFALPCRRKWDTRWYKVVNAKLPSQLRVSNAGLHEYCFVGVA